MSNKSKNLEKATPTEKEKKIKHITIYNVIIKSSYKSTSLFLYNPRKGLKKQWSVKSKNYPKVEKRKNTKYNFHNMVKDFKRYLLDNKIVYLTLIFDGISGFGRKFFLNFFLEKGLKEIFYIYKIFDKTPTPFNGCRPKKKKR